jgi:hypothetical protein
MLSLLWKKQYSLVDQVADAFIAMKETYHLEISPSYAQNIFCFW